MKLRLALAALLVSMTAALSATAQQPWIQDRRIGEAAGIRTGNLELHPSLAGEVGYDSNYFQRAETGDPDKPIDAMLFRITPSLTLSTLGGARKEGEPQATPPVINFDLAAFLTYNAFLPLDDSDDFEDRSRTSGGANAGLEIFPGRQFTGDIHAGYRRQIDASDIATGDTDFDRHVLSGGLGLTWRPGGGLFDWRVGYDINTTYFTEQGFDSLNNAQHVFGTRGRWRFLPRTALIYDGQYRLIRYSEDALDQSDGEVIQSQIGLSGLFTTRFAFRVMGGWAASFYNQPVNFDGPIGNAEIKYFLLPQPRLHEGSAQVGLSSIAVGYDRNYAHSYVGPYYQRDRGYMTFEYFIGGLVVVALRGHITRNSYPEFTIINAAGDTQTIDNLYETRFGGTLFAEYRVMSNFGINATLDYDQNVAGGSNPVPVVPQDNLDYSRFQAFLGARLFW